LKPLGYAPLALADLKAIGRYIAADNPNRATSFIAELRVKAAQAAERPRSFPQRDDVSPGLRAARHGSYLILFRDLADQIRVVRVLHAARDLKAAFDQ